MAGTTKLVFVISVLCGLSRLLNESRLSLLLAVLG